MGTDARARERLGDWFFQGTRPSAAYAGPHQRPDRTERTHPWWKVMCLTGVDYFSTLGYQPGIAILAAGLLSPMATLVLVLVTLCGALPVYRWVAAVSPRGAGSIHMLERLLPRWTGKITVLVLLGFTCTDFVITITLSSADAAVHIVENPYLPDGASRWQFWVTMGLLLLLAAVFLGGFSEAIKVALVLVPLYLLVNLVVVAGGLVRILQSPELFSNWWSAAMTSHSSPLAAVAVALLVFPKLALGLSGFETGVAVMPQLDGHRREHRDGRKRRQPAATSIRAKVAGAHRLLTTSALIMAFFLMTTSFICTVLIPAAALEGGGAANGRALAYLAHDMFGEVFGTVYDASTVLILWFAGASAMAGMLNLIPRYLPRYGMAPEWTRATRPLVVAVLSAAVIVTWIFGASVDAQGNAYATGVLALITSAAVAVTLSARSHGRRKTSMAFGAVALVFVYTFVDNIITRPDGLHIALVFVTVLLTVSFASRVWRASELRVNQIEWDDRALAWIGETTGRTVRLIAQRPEAVRAVDYSRKLLDEWRWHGLMDGPEVLFVEVNVRDPSDFEDDLKVCAREVDGYRVLHVDGSSVATCLAALALDIGERTGRVAHVYVEWSSGAAALNHIRFLLFGRGQTATTLHEVLRRTVHDDDVRPVVHVM
ncbi:amino acid transporter [Kocuria coralli]|uniref:Amino acid transporter n=1 Tax=Kocuria coralli TaxID=1461025 RepID=A0A5J5KUD3_9MICC|nr:amino acid transporter [Kocuria coralli]KAA9392988.1 amino acid transporter [Kocuria coralli]